MTKTRSLRPVATVTFLNYAARGLTFPFISLYLVAVGFSGVQIGIVLSVSAALRLVVPPLLNAAADRLGRHRQLYYALVTGNAVATFALVLAAFSQWWLGATVVIRDSLDTPSASLLSQLTITQLEQHGRDIYGRIRAWGSLGWAVTTLLSGLLFGIGGYASLFITAAALNLASLPFARLLPARTTDVIAGSPTESAVQAGRPRGFYVLMLTWFLFYVGMSAVSGFLYVYFQRDLGASNAMIGVLAAVAAIAEIPSMVIIDRLMHRVGSRMTLSMGVLGMAGLWLAFTLLDGPALLLPLMAVRGTFYTFQNVGITLLVSRISHPLLITGPIAGWIFDNVGPRELFQTVALVAFLAVLLMLAFRRSLDLAQKYVWFREDYA